VTNGANVYVRFATFKFFLSHELIPFHIKDRLKEQRLPEN